MITNRPLADWSKDELRRQLRVMAPHTGIAYNDVLRELDRRDANDQARNSFILSVVATVIAVVAVVVTALKS